MSRISLHGIGALVHGPIVALLAGPPMLPIGAAILILLTPKA